MSRAIGRGLQPGDEVVITELDHHANVAPWQALAKERGITLRMVPMVPETPQLDWSAFEQIVTARTRVVAVGAASNMLGTISDVKRAARLAHSVGALCYVDAVHFCCASSDRCPGSECDFPRAPHISSMDRTSACSTRRTILRSGSTPKLNPH